MVHTSGKDAESAVGENSEVGLVVDLFRLLHDLGDHGGEFLGQRAFGCWARVTAS